MLSKRDEHIGYYLTFRITMYVLTCSTFFIADEISPPNVVIKKGSINNGKLTTRNMYLYLLHYHYYNKLFIIVFDEWNVVDIRGSTIRIFIFTGCS